MTESTKSFLVIYRAGAGLQTRRVNAPKMKAFVEASLAPMIAALDPDAASAPRYFNAAMLLLNESPVGTHVSVGPEGSEIFVLVRTA